MTHDRQSKHTRRAFPRQPWKAVEVGKTPRDADEATRENSLVKFNLFRSFRDSVNSITGLRNRLRKRIFKTNRFESCNMRVLYYIIHIARRDLVLRSLTDAYFSDRRNFIVRVWNY